ncbi:hypothetical protein AAMO2058_000172700 [Amorphochlora amoebiformis]
MDDDYVDLSLLDNQTTSLGPGPSLKEGKGMENQVSEEKEAVKSLGGGKVAKAENRPNVHRATPEEPIQKNDKKRPSKKETDGRLRTRVTRRKSFGAARGAICKQILLGLGALAVIVGLAGIILMAALDDEGVASYAETEYLNEIFSLSFLVGFIVFVAAARPFKVGVFLGLWTLWLIWALFREGETVLMQVYHRAETAADSTRLFVRQGGAMLAAWGRLLAPFAADIVDLLIKGWNHLTLEAKGFILVGLLVLFGVVRTYRLVRERSDAILVAIFQASYLLVGPGVYLAVNLLPPRVAISTTTIALTLLPSVLSILAFRTSEMGQREQRGNMFAGWKKCDVWLSYWSCWPILTSLLWAIVSYVADPLICTQLLAVLVALAIWLQFWFGSKTFFSLASILFAQIHPVVDMLSPAFPGFSTLRSMLSSSFSLSRQMSFMGTLSSLWDNRWTVGPVVLVVAGMIITLGLRLYTFLTNTLSAAIFWGVAFKSAKAIREKRSAQYSELLAFWILTQLTQVLVYVPVLGSMIGLFQPVLLPVYLVMGEQFVSILLGSLGDQYLSIVAAAATIIAATIFSEQSE